MGTVLLQLYLPYEILYIGGYIRFDMRVSVKDAWKFPGGFYIFEQGGSQIDPESRIGKQTLKILARQKQDKIDSKPQKYRAEVAHNKDIDGDGHIGTPPEDSPIAKKDKPLTVKEREDNQEKKEKKTKKKKGWL